MPVASEQPAASNLETDVLLPSPVADPADSSPPNLSKPVPEPVPVRRYPVRVLKPPARLGFMNFEVTLRLCLFK